MYRYSSNQHAGRRLHTLVLKGGSPKLPHKPVYLAVASVAQSASVAQRPKPEVCGSVSTPVFSFLVIFLNSKLKTENTIIFSKLSWELNQTWTCQEKRTFASDVAVDVKFNWGHQILFENMKFKGGYLIILQSLKDLAWITVSKKF